MAADTPEDLRGFRDKLGLSFTMLSDPELRSVEALDLPISTSTAYYSALLLHPEIRHYPRRAFLQPALFMWRQAALVYEWRQTEKLRNLFGATGRPSDEDVVRIVTEAALKAP